jgi:hypothetical protein
MFGFADNVREGFGINQRHRQLFAEHVPITVHLRESKYAPARLMPATGAVYPCRRKRGLFIRWELLRHRTINLSISPAAREAFIGMERQMCKCGVGLTLILVGSVGRVLLVSFQS